MRKKDLMLFIEKVQAKAVRSIEEKFDKLISEEKYKVINAKGYQDRANKLQKKINDLHQEVSDLVLDVKEDISVKYECYSNPAYYLSQVAGKSSFEYSIIHNSKFSGGSVQVLRDKKAKEIEEVKLNYNKVYQVSNSLTSADKIATYLKELGFDISDVEKKDTVYLMCQIDKTKLFVCGENK